MRNSTRLVIALATGVVVAVCTQTARSDTVVSSSRVISVYYWPDVDPPPGQVVAWTRTLSVWNNPCPADFDLNGSTSPPQPADIAFFVNFWFASLQAGDKAGDFDANNQVDPADVASFVNYWFRAVTTLQCPPP